MDRLDESRTFSKQNIAQEVEEMWYHFAERINFLVDRIEENWAEIVKPGNSVGDDGNWRVTCDSDGDLQIQLKVSGTWTDVETTKGS